MLGLSCQERPDCLFVNNGIAVKRKVFVLFSESPKDTTRTMSGFSMKRTLAQNYKNGMGCFTELSASSMLSGHWLKLFIKCLHLKINVS